MMLIKWDELPIEMQTDEVRRYYDILSGKKVSLVSKRLFDILCSLILIVLFSPIFLVLAIAIKTDSPGPVFYRQERVTQYGRRFFIHKFRTMVNDADSMGTLVTVKNDNRITRVGRVIRKHRLDEFSQLIDVLEGSMTFVGTRPEVVKYVERYSPEMMATLLLPAGVTNLACLYYKDESDLLDGAEDPDSVYVEKILPGKMYYNLKGVERFSFFGDMKLMLMTFLTVFGKDFEPDRTTEEDFEKKVKENTEVH